MISFSFFFVAAGILLGSVKIACASADPHLQERAVGIADTVAFTTFAGLFSRATGAPPYRLPSRWTTGQAKLDPTTVLDFATTNDITGGSSGSPVVNAKGQIVGAAFDGNIHSIAGDFTYDGALNRTIAVSTAAISQALERVYGDAALAKELSDQ